MTGLGSVLPGGAGLVVAVDGQGWGLTLRRADLRAADTFAKHHGKEVTAADVARFLPNWRSLSWTQVPGNLLSSHELSALEGEYAISISTGSSGRMQRDELVTAFLRFMME